MKEKCAKCVYYYQKGFCLRKENVITSFLYGLIAHVINIKTIYSSVNNHNAL